MHCSHVFSAVSVPGNSSIPTSSTASSSDAGSPSRPSAFLRDVNLSSCRPCDPWCSHGFLLQLGTRDNFHCILIGFFDAALARAVLGSDYAEWRKGLTSESSALQGSHILSSSFSDSINEAVSLGGRSSRPSQADSLLRIALDRSRAFRWTSVLAVAQRWTASSDQQRQQRYSARVTDAQLVPLVQARL